MVYVTGKHATAPLAHRIGRQLLRSRSLPCGAVVETFGIRVTNVLVVEPVSFALLLLRALVRVAIRASALHECSACRVSARVRWHVQNPGSGSSAGSDPFGPVLPLPRAA